MDTKLPITVQAVINVPVAVAWDTWTLPEHIEHWAFASPEWEARDAVNDVREGGVFKTVMAAKDGSASFDFTGVYTAVKNHKLIAYALDDGRNVRIEFAEDPKGTRVTETFDPENENPVDMQRAGWQSILDNYKQYAEQR